MFPNYSLKSNLSLSICSYKSHFNILHSYIQSRKDFVLCVFLSLLLYFVHSINFSKIFSCGVGVHSDIKMNICLKEAAEHLHFSAMYFCYIRFILLSSGLSEFTIHFHERVIEFLILGSSTNKQIM